MPSQQNHACIDVGNLLLPLDQTMGWYCHQLLGCAQLYNQGLQSAQRIYLEDVDYYRKTLIL